MKVLQWITNTKVQFKNYSISDSDKSDMWTVNNDYHLIDNA